MSLLAVQHAQDPRDGDLAPSPAGCRARSAARRRPSRARTPRAAGRRRARRRHQGRVDVDEVLVEELRPAASSQPVGRRDAARGSGTPTRRTRTSGASPRRPAAASASAGARERAGGLALEVDQHPVVVRPQRLAEVEVAVVADHAADRPDVRELAQPVADLLAAPEDRRQLRRVRQVEEEPLDLLVDARGQERERSGLGSSGAKLGSAGSEPSALCSSAVTSPSRVPCAGSQPGNPTRSCRGRAASRPRATGTAAAVARESSRAGRPS